MRRRQLVAFRFHLHRAIHETASRWLELTDGFTHYLRLLNRLFDWQLDTGVPIRLATFNYDVMLESALEDFFGWQFGSLARYIERDGFRVFKLHGSTTWSRLIPTRLAQGVASIEAAMQVAMENEFPEGEIQAYPPYPFVDIARTAPSPSPNQFTIPACHVCHP